MIKTKSFYCACEDYMDEFINEWIQENPEYEIISIEHGGFYDHEGATNEAVLVLYKEKGNDELASPYA